MSKKMKAKLPDLTQVYRFGADIWSALIPPTEPYDILTAIDRMAAGRMVICDNSDMIMFCSKGKDGTPLFVQGHKDDYPKRKPYMFSSFSIRPDDLGKKQFRDFTPPRKPRKRVVH
jgi:hypothetical protein